MDGPPLAPIRPSGKHTSIVDVAGHFASLTSAPLSTLTIAAMPAIDLSPYADLDCCYLTTTGRTSGLPREIEIWFAAHDGLLYLLSGGRDRSHWVRNIRKDPAVRVRLGEETFAGTARLLDAGTAEDALARKLVFAKYTPRYSGDLDNWRESSLPVAIQVAGLV